MKTGKGKVTVLFSGGMDSSAVALFYLKKGCKVQLITFDNGAERDMDNPRIRADLIKRKFGTQCSWKLLSSRELFHRIAIKNLEKDIKNYGNLICCGCKLAMLAELIIYCKKHGIKIIADGFEKGQVYYPEQHPDYISATDSFAKGFGISYEHPVYKMSAKAIKKINSDAGITAEPVQVECLFGLNRVKNKNIKKYTKMKLPLARKYIKSILRKDSQKKRNRIL